VTVLFTDLVGSTALSTSMAAADAERIRLLHFGLLRDAVEAHGGREVKNLGDGIMAVFPGASAALEAATAMQQAIHQHNRTDGSALAIRVGVATGDCTEEAGDYFGEPVIQAARLCAASEGGQILVTSVVGLLVPRDAYELRAVGDLDLKGLPEPVATLELAWEPAQTASAPTIPLPTRLTVQGGLSPLVGRLTEREVLDAALKAAVGGERQVVLITGEAGMGKTRLTTEFAAEAFDAGAIVLYGRCDEELALPYLPWVESLSHCIDHLDDAVIHELDAAISGPLSRLIPALRQRLATSDERAEDSQSGDQYALFGAITGLLAEVASSRTLVVVLDDLHWADRGTLQVLQHVTTSLPNARLVVIGTYRETDLGADDPLLETSARLHREVGVHRIALGGLSDLEVVELLEGAAGHELGSDAVSMAHVLRADTAGNPFFVVEVLRHLVETGALTQRDGRWTVTRALDDLELPQSVRAVVGQRVRRLSPAAHAVLTAGAVAGREFDTAVVAGATDLDEDDVLAVLEEAMGAGLIAEVSGAVDRFTFTHALVQQTLYSDLSESRRARMHRQVATCIEGLVGDDAGDRAGELAQHWFAAVRPAELDRAISYALQAGDRAIEASAPDEAVRWFAQALDAIGDGRSELRCEVQVRLGDAERQAGRETSRQRLLDAAETALRLGRSDLLIASALANYRGWHSRSGDVDHQRVAMLEAALEHAESDPASRARLLATLAGELTYTDDPRRFDMAREAEELGRSLEDQKVLLDALERVGSSINVPEMLPERQRRAAKVMELTSSGTDPVRRFWALESQTDVHLATANMAEARACSTERRAIAEHLGQPTFVWLATHGDSLLDIVEGDVDAAAAGTDAAVELGFESGQPDAMTYFAGMLMQIHMHRHQYTEIIPVARERLEALPNLSAVRAVLVNFLCQNGEMEEAKQLLAGMADGGFTFDRDLVWLASTALVAESAAIVGDRASVALLHDRLARYADQCITTRAYCIGPVGYYLGVASAALGDVDAAQRHFRTAIELSEGLRAPFHSARSMLGLAELLQSADRAKAAALLAEVEALAELYKMPGQAARARQLIS
jgi:class 3 adenylate cyclase/tetratricopeptide (TPR) repeat protein